jgi:hypothetical protein
MTADRVPEELDKGETMSPLSSKTLCNQLIRLSRDDALVGQAFAMAYDAGYVGKDAMTFVILALADHIQRSARTNQ